MSDQEKVRLLISDVGGDGGEDFIFTDTEIEGFLSLRNGNVMLAAALALRTLAANEALVMKRVTFMQLSSDGPAVAAELSRLANQLTEQAHEAAGARIGTE